MKITHNETGTTTTVELSRQEMIFAIMIMNEWAFEDAAEEVDALLTGKRKED